MALSMTNMMIFLAVATGLAGLGSLISDIWFRDRSRANNRIDKEFRKQQRKQVETSSLFKDFKGMIKATQDQETEVPWWERAEGWVDQSGVDLTLQKLLTWSVALAGSLGLVGYVARQNWFVAGVGVLLGGLIPILFVEFKRRQRREKMHSQLAEAFETISRGMRCGQSLLQALSTVATECERPIADEFSLCFEQQRLGLPPEAAFQDLAKRVDLLEMRLFVVAALVQQRAGSNMAELVEELSKMVRDRYRAKQKLQTLTAESRLQANVLLGLPVVVFFILLLIKRDYAQALLDNPSLLGITFAFQVLGMLWIRKIVKLVD